MQWRVTRDLRPYNTVKKRLSEFTFALAKQIYPALCIEDMQEATVPKKGRKDTLSVQALRRCLYTEYNDCFTTAAKGSKYICFNKCYFTQRSMRIPNLCLPGHAGAELVKLPMSFSV